MSASMQGKYEEAERLLVEAVSMAQQGWGDKDIHVYAAKNNLGYLYQILQKYDAAKALQTQARWGLRLRLPLALYLAYREACIPPVSCPNTCFESDVVVSDYATYGCRIQASSAAAHGCGMLFVVRYMASVLGESS